MSDEMSDDIVNLAKEYLDSLDQDSTVENLQEVKGEIEYWEEQVEEFEKGTAMHEMAVEKLDDWREKLEAFEARGERREELRDELLSWASTEFAPHGERLQPLVFEALSHALTNRRRQRLLVGGFSLPDDIDDMSAKDMVSAAKTVHAVTKDAIEDEDRISELWDKLNTDTRLPIVRVLGENEDTLSSGEISEKLGEGGTDNPGANIRKVRGVVDFDPFHSTGNGYTLSLVGRYLWNEYGEDLPETEKNNNGDGQEQIDKDEQETDGQSDEEGEVVASDEEDDRSEKTDDEVDLSSFEVRE